MQLRADQHVGETVDGNAPALVRVGIGVGNTLPDDVHLGSRVLERHARLELGARAEPAKITRHVRRLEGKGCPNLGCGAIEGTAFLKDADHGVCLAVQQDVPSQHCGIGTEAAFPEHMAQQHDMILAELVLARKKRAAQRWLRSEDIEVVRRDARASDHRPARPHRSTLHANQLPRPCTRRRRSGSSNRDSSGWRRH